MINVYIPDDVYAEIAVRDNAKIVQGRNCHCLSLELLHSTDYQRERYQMVEIGLRKPHVPALDRVLGLDSLFLFRVTIYRIHNEK